MKHALAVALAAAALTFGLPSPAAHADELDDAFFYTLQTLGFYDYGPASIENARWLCDRVWSGISPYQATAELDDELEYLDYTETKLFAQAAIATYCPPA